MNLIKKLRISLLFGLLWVAPASAELIGGGGQGLNSFFEQAWRFFFG